MVTPQEQDPKLQSFPENETELRIPVCKDDFSELQKAVTGHPALKSVSGYEIMIDHPKSQMVICLRGKISRIPGLANVIQEILVAARMKLRAA